MNDFAAPTRKRARSEDEEGEDEGVREVSMRVKIMSRSSLTGFVLLRHHLCVVSEMKRRIENRVRRVSKALLEQVYNIQ